jgi:hypothetical protein
MDLSNIMIGIDKTSLTPPLFIEVHVSSQESERSCMPLSTILRLNFGTVPTE